MEPEIAPGLGGLLRGTEVSSRECEWIIRPHHEFAGRIVCDISVLIVDNADLEAFEYRTHQSWLLVLDGRTQYEVGFRGSPAIEQTNACALCEFLVKLRWNTRRESDPNRMRGLLRRGKPREQDRHHSAQEIGDGRSVVGERSKKSRCGKPLLEANSRASQKGLIKGIERIGMKQWQARAEDIVSAQLQQRCGVDRPPEILRLRAADALRRAGGAGGIEDQRRIAGLHRSRRHPVATARHRDGNGRS